MSAVTIAACAFKPEMCANSVLASVILAAGGVLPQVISQTDTPTREPDWYMYGVRMLNKTQKISECRSKNDMTHLVD